MKYSGQRNLIFYDIIYLHVTFSISLKLRFKRGTSIYEINPYSYFATSYSHSINIIHSHSSTPQLTKGGRVIRACIRNSLIYRVDFFTELQIFINIITVILDKFNNLDVA